MAAVDTSYRFHHFRLLPEQRQLLEGDTLVKIGARALDLLVVLLEHRDRVVSKHELLDLVWPKLVVEENNLQVQVLALRKLLGHGAIGTVPGRGYRFTLPVERDGNGKPSPALIEPLEPARSGNLPAQPSQIIGREEDLATLQRLLEQHGLVTVAGAGGIGKTRLAQGIAHDPATQPTDGVWWVDLSSLNDPTLVPLAVGQALGLPLAGLADASVAVLNALQGKSALLVMDNAEHLLEGVARFAAAVRERAGRVKLLVTSQEVLHLIDEQVFRPDPLSLPALDDLHSAQGSGAVALFVTRAHQADPRFELSERNLHAVVDICRRLDGIPLAIELAAARVRLLGVDGVHQRLGERFSMLTAGARAVLRRHQTLRATLEWSHGLLTAAEQVVLRRLAVFVGGFTLEAAQEAAMDESIDAWDVLELLGALVDKSMVVAEGDKVPRYRLLETTRMYALERLAEARETDTMLRRHAEFQMQLGEAFDAAATGLGRTAGPLQQMDLERDNLLHALDWCSRQGGAEPAAIGLRLVASLRYYWTSRGMLRAGIAAAQRALDCAREQPGDEHRCKALGSLVQMLNLTEGPSERTDRACAELVETARTSGHRLSILTSGLMAGYVAVSGKQWAAAEEHFEGALGVARDLGKLNLECNAMDGLALVLEGRGQIAEAQAMLEAALTLRRRTGHDHNIAVGLTQLAWLTIDRNELARASALLCESVPLIRASGSVGLEATLVANVARLLARLGQWEASVELHAAAAERRRDYSTTPNTDDLRIIQADLGAAHAALGAVAHERAWTAGAALDHAAAFDLTVRRLVASAAPTCS